MKNILLRSIIGRGLLALLILTGCMLTDGYTQDLRKVGVNGVTSVKFTANRGFVIGLQGQATRIEIDLFVEYDEAASKILLRASDDTVKLTTDLSFEFFRIKLDKLVKEATGRDNTISLGSAMEIYYWVYTLVKAEEKGPRSGFLMLDQYVMVLANGQELSGANDYRVRTQTVDEFTGNVIKLNTELSHAKDLAINELKQQLDILRAKFGHNKYSIEFHDYIDLNPALPKGQKYKRIVLNDTTVELNFWDDLLKELQYKKIETVRLESAGESDSRKLIVGSSDIGGDELYIELMCTDSYGSESSIGNGEGYDFIKLISQPLNIALAAKTELKKLQAELIENKLYKVKDVQLQFERGFLERVQITVELEGRDQIFENIYPIGFSSPADYKAISKIRLYIRNNYLSENGSEHYIYLGDVLQNYDNELNNYTRDYSPADTSLRVKPEEDGFVVLYKEKLVNLFEAKIYTDLIGVLKNEPNGLVQIELERRFNLLTKRSQIPGTRQDIGFLNYMMLSATISKIENKQRKLSLLNDNVLQNNQLVSPSYATNLDFRKYENLGIQTEFNLFLWDYPDGKTTFYIDPGFRYSYTPVIDSVRVVDNTGALVVGPEVNDFNAHLFTLYPKFAFEFFAERRYGFSMSYQFNHSWLFSNNQYKQVRSYEKGDNSLLPIENSARNSHQIDLFLRIEPNPKSSNGKIFARARFYMQQGDVNTFFSQIQLGYAYNFIYSR